MKDKKTYVLDTNVLMHDPAALFRFAEHDIYLPMVVLEELDNNKKGVSEVARNVRQVSRFIDDLIAANPSKSLSEGLVLATTKISGDQQNTRVSGTLNFQHDAPEEALPASFPGELADNQILAAAYDLSLIHI